MTIRNLTVSKKMPVFSENSDASEFCESKRVNGVATLGPKKNNPINGKGWASYKSNLWWNVTFLTTVWEWMRSRPRTRPQNRQDRKNRIFPC